MATTQQKSDALESSEEKIITITPKAMERIVRVRENTGESPDAGLRIEINGIQGGEFAYDLSFTDPESIGEDESVIEYDGLKIVMRERDVPKIKGSVLDLSDDPNEGLTIDNPNDVWEFVGGELAKRVQAVLDENVNPAIAMHGGRADLVAVEDSTAYLRLSGGCQGCGLAKVTLSQGIEVAIKEAVPEIESIVDVTDHASGTNPYYEPSKK
jgi:Fe/S biogenesis protein NfuA